MPQAIADFIRSQAQDIQPRIAILLGSGLGEVAKSMTNSTVIAYKDIPNFPVSTVSGHAGQLHIGLLNNVPVICLQGRIHYYENPAHQHIKHLVRSLKCLGCEEIIITNAAGSLREDIPPGNFMLINDHINFQGCNPLVGDNDDEFGPRFVSMDQAYDKALREQLLSVAKELNIPLKQGVYLATRGPMFETPAEIRAFKCLGADAVGMSTVPEVIVARHCGLRVCAISTMTNMAAGMNDETLSHEGTLHHANLAAEKLTQLLLRFVERIHAS